VQARGPNKATHIEEAYTKKVAEMKQIIARFGGPRELDIAPGPAATVNNPAMTPGAVAARDENFLATIPAEDRQIFLDARAGKPVNADIKGTRELAATLPAPDELLGTSPGPIKPSGPVKATEQSLKHINVEALNSLNETLEGSLGSIGELSFSFNSRLSGGKSSATVKVRRRN